MLLNLLVVRAKKVKKVKKGRVEKEEEEEGVEEVVKKIEMMGRIEIKKDLINNLLFDII